MRRSHHFIGPITVVAVGLGLWGWWGFGLVPRTLDASPHSTVVLDRSGRLIGAVVASDGQWRFEPSPVEGEDRLALAVQLAEDRRLGWHPGVDPVAVLRAGVRNIREKRVVEGASTLAMQVARMARRLQGKGMDRTLSDKFLEALMAVRLTLGQGSSGVREQWLALAPFGGNVVGAEAAAWRWFDRPRADLGWAEAAVLAVLPNAPGRVHPGGDRSTLRRRRDALLQDLYHQGHLSTQELAVALEAPLPARPHVLPRHAPHLVDRLRRLRPGQTVRVHIDLEVQSRLTDLARVALEPLASTGIPSVALLAVETPIDGPPRIRAYVGQVSRLQATEAVDMIPAARSPGSTLKPLIMGLALDEGRILSSTLIPDVPVRLDGFAPENADGEHLGLVPADRALSSSRNVPWVLLLRELGGGAMLDRLRAGGFWYLLPDPNHYGLGLALGGFEAGLEELAAFHAALGRDGVRAALELVPADGSKPPLWLAEPREPGLWMTAQAAWQVLQALSQGGRTGEEGLWRATGAGANPAWKTGTSFGHRDAWAIGSTPRWTVAVWAGSPDGTPHAELWGSRAAAPLLFRALASLPPDPQRPRFNPPAGLIEVEACAVTGWRAGASCPHRIRLQSTEAGATAPVCRWHVPVLVDARGRRAHPGCAGGAALEGRVALDPPALAASFWREGRWESQMPPWSEACGERGGRLAVARPTSGSRIVRVRGPSGDPLPVVAEIVGVSTDSVFCWLDGAPAGRPGPDGRLLLDPPSGRRRLLCLGSGGSRDSVAFDVLMPQIH